MKKILLSLTALIVLVSGKSQVTENSSTAMQQIALTAQNDQVKSSVNETAGSYAAGLSIRSSNAPIAVNLTRFSGNLNSNKATLNWALASNETTDRFEVERSYDGINFTTVALVFTSERSGAESYGFHENINWGGNAYYRLKRYDNSQTVSYSKIIVFRTDLMQKSR